MRSTSLPRSRRQSEYAEQAHGPRHLELHTSEGTGRLRAILTSPPGDAHPWCCEKRGMVGKVYAKRTRSPTWHPFPLDRYDGAASNTASPASDPILQVEHPDARLQPEPG